MSSNQVRETQIARFAAIAFYFREIETRLNDEFHHRFVTFEAQRNRVRLDVDDDRSLYQVQLVHFIKENVKC
jgi:aminoglycoside N3'-acetyltransferase